MILEAKAVYDRLDADFVKEGITDLNWKLKMPELDEYLHAGFKESGMGLMCDFTGEIERVFTTVFLSEKVLSEILRKNVSNALVFSHHPTDWSIKRRNGTFAAKKELIEGLKERNISIYILHHPLDNYGEYSTCRTLADILKIEIEEPAFLYCGAMCGVIGTTACETAGELRELYSRAVGHKTSLYLYGGESIKGERIAICPGGGNDMAVFNEMKDRKIRNLITGVSIVNEHTEQVHRLEKENGINVFGGTHYSSEKFAPIKMCGYFRSLGLPAEFIEDMHDLYDL